MEDQGQGFYDKINVYSKLDWLEKKLVVKVMYKRVATSFSIHFFGNGGQKLGEEPEGYGKWDFLKERKSY